MINNNCNNCGGDMVGDGYTMSLHCEFTDLPLDREADAEPLYCKPEETIIPCMWDAFTEEEKRQPMGIACPCPKCSPTTL
tara:strand:- start:2989 stop:3228 length:240 start_codon:yes stop_codon:yes gene_type:complete